jgi:hypothetical protein
MNGAMGLLLLLLLRGVLARCWPLQLPPPPLQQLHPMTHFPVPIPPSRLQRVRKSWLQPRCCDGSW